MSVEAGPLPLDGIFRPRGVAVVGASPWQYGVAGAGAGYIRALLELGFPAVYPVNPKHQEIEGLRCYPDLRAIEGAVDQVISAVPATAVPGLLDDCIAKGVRTLHLFTAGFSETGDEAMGDMERQVVARARKAGMRVLGPNCMGLYVPASRLSFIPGLPPEPGPVALISQSGTNAGEMVRSSAPRGLRYSKVVSYGNAADIDASDLLDYLAADSETEIIACYIEGVRDGRRFFQAMRKAAAAKPVVVFKSGRTEAGTRAARSHTASLAGSARIFETLCRQVGAVQAASLAEMVDVCVAFRYLPSLAGPRMAVVGGGGGFSVFAADETEEAGLQCPTLPEAVQRELLEFIPAAGSSVRNPVDAFVVFDPSRLGRTLAAVGQAENVDAIIYQIDFSSPGFSMSPSASDPSAFIDSIVAQMTAAREASGKPVVVVANQPLDAKAVENTIAFQEKCWRGGFAVFPTISRASRALSKALGWREARQRDDVRYEANVR